jgi:hypothetical protein
VVDVPRSALVVHNLQVSAALIESQLDDNVPSGPFARQPPLVRALERHE